MLFATDTSGPIVPVNADVVPAGYGFTTLVTVIVRFARTVEVLNIEEKVMRLPVNE
jgi:hypothetical protein